MSSSKQRERRNSHRHPKQDDRNLDDGYEGSTAPREDTGHNDLCIQNGNDPRPRGVFIKPRH
jgi:hypothetical protein